MENERIEKSNTELLKIELNNEGEYITLSADDPALFDKVVSGLKHISDLAGGLPDKIREIEKQYKGKNDFNSRMEKVIAISRENVGFSEEAVRVIDSIFGEDTVKKYFRSIYNEISDFLPDADCIIDFFEQITPPMEKLFNRKAETRELLSKTRMAKYQPQDHQRPRRNK